MAVGLVLLRAQYLRDEALAVVRVGRGEVRDHIRAVDADPGLRENPFIVQYSDGSAQGLLWLTKVLCGMRLTSELESFWVMKYFMSASRQSCGICDEYPKVSGSQKMSLRSPNLLWK